MICVDDILVEWLIVDYQVILCILMPSINSLIGSNQVQTINLSTHHSTSVHYHPWCSITCRVVSCRGIIVIHIKLCMYSLTGVINEHHPHWNDESIIFTPNYRSVCHSWSRSHLILFCLLVCFVVFGRMNELDVVRWVSLLNWLINWLRA